MSGQSHKKYARKASNWQFATTICAEAASSPQLADEPEQSCHHLHPSDERVQCPTSTDQGLGLPSKAWHIERAFFGEVKMISTVYYRK
jgi:hypothetical protein